MKKRKVLEDKQRLATLSRVNASRRSQSPVLALVRDRGLPDNISLQKFQRVRHAVAQSVTPYGSLKYVGSYID